MPGSGKSSIGREVAKRLGRPFVDCDKVVEQRAGCTIARLFERDGETAFRDLEAEVLVTLLEDRSSVVATGGGAVLRAINRELLRTRSQCVFLNASPAFLWQRLRRDRRRPLLQVAEPEERLRELFVERELLYRETASVVIDAESAPFDRLVATILGHVGSGVQAP
ncbi:MAG TPA: shikimate kinase [Caldimonas sp.]